MPELIATSPFEGLHLPVEHGACRLDGIDPGPVTSVAPFAGAGAAVAQALAPLVPGFPAPNTVLSGNGARMVWSGVGQALLIGAAAPDALSGLAALTDQSDGWASLRLTGAGTSAVLARLVPLDLRPAAFPVGAAARSLLNHIPLLLMRPDAAGLDLMVYRSMVGSAVHEISVAMVAVAARG